MLQLCEHAQQQQEWGGYKAQGTIWYISKMAGITKIFWRRKHLPVCVEREESIHKIINSVGFSDFRIVRVLAVGMPPRPLLKDTVDHRMVNNEERII